MELKDYIATIENYPKEGVVFRDISPLMADGNAYNYAATEIVQYARDKEIDMVVGPEARGFIIGCPVAFALGVGFAPVRKPGKLPREVIEATYEKEYGTDTLTMHSDSIKPGQRVLIVDDLQQVEPLLQQLNLLKKWVELLSVVPSLSNLTSLKVAKKSEITTIKF